jgi:hypothetical protein
MITRFEQVDGTISYRLRDSILHRPNGPAKMWGEGTWYWCLYGVRHRYYGPASWMGDWSVKGFRINHA